MCNLEEKVIFSLLLNPQYLLLFNLWPVEHLSHRKAFSWGSENFKQFFPETKGRVNAITLNELLRTF